VKTIRVQIEAIDDEGRGRGVLADQDVAVRGAFIGDDVEMQPERNFAARNLVVGKALHFYTKGACHTDRSCQHPSPCPACPLHGAQISLAAEIKRGRIERALSDAGMDFPVDDLLFHPHEFGYRQKVKLMAHMVDNQLRLGVYVPYSHDFVVAEQCPYVNSQINSAITSLLEVFNQQPAADLAQIKAIILRAGQNGVSAVVVLKRDVDLKSALNSCVLQGILESALVRVQTKESNSVLEGERAWHIGPELIAPLEGGPAVDPDSFCQSDPEQATRMYNLVAEFLTTGGSQGLFVDAYAGVGGFTRALQRRGVTQIVAIEQSVSAKASLETLGVEVLITPMSNSLTRLESRKPFAGIVVDPPKKGLMGDAAGIAALGAPKVALVSCDPDAMASDLKTFLQYSYQVERIIPMDLFGGTPAVETIVLLSK